jgi:DNA adenine methylase
MVALLRPSGPSPFVKWVGGKGKLLGELCTRAPLSYRRYFEPFLGGGALFFRMRPKAAALSDVNAELIGCWRAVRDDLDAVMAALSRHRARHSEEYYYSTRVRWNAGHGRGDDTCAAERAATFLYLNKTCYNGLWRVNSRGEFNVPAGRYENPTILDRENLRAASNALAGQDIHVAGFEGVLDNAGSGDFVYFDPPYHPISETSDFTSYTPGKFDASDQARLSGV